MRQPNKRELILVLVFLLAALIIGGMIGSDAYFAYLKARKNELKMQTLQLQEMRRWVSEKDAWNLKTAWLANNAMPVYKSEETASAFAEWTQQSLAQNGIQILEQRLAEPQKQGGLVAVGIDVVISAPLEQFVRWLHKAQEAGQFCEVTHLKLKSDAGDSKIRAEISLVRLCEPEGTRPTP